MLSRGLVEFILKKMFGKINNNSKRCQNSCITFLKQFGLTQEDEEYQLKIGPCLPCPGPVKCQNTLIGADYPHLFPASSLVVSTSKWP